LNSLSLQGKRTRKGPRQSVSFKRVLQPQNVKIGADPSGTNLITKRPFSYKVGVTEAYNSTTLASNYAAVFPDLVTDKITGVRIDRVAVWGGSDSTTYLTVGKYYSRRDTAGKDAHARLCCLPKLHDPQCDETTLIRYEGAKTLMISGVVYLKREALPGEVVEASDGYLPVAFSNSDERSNISGAPLVSNQGQGPSALSSCASCVRSKDSS